MTTKLLQTAPHEAESQTESSLREAFVLLQHHLKPPFPLTIPSPSEYSNLNRAILYGILTEPHSAKTHFTHLNGIVTDGYDFFVSSLLEIATTSYPKLLEAVRVQLTWLLPKLIDVSAIGIENLFVCLLRQINGADFTGSNLWLSGALVRVLTDKWDWLRSVPSLLTGALYTYLRLLADHSRLSGQNLDEIKRIEIDFCVRVLREEFGLCLRIGRDLIRLLQDLMCIVEFRSIWKDLLMNPGEFRVPGFSDVSQIYVTRTSSRYFLLRVSPEMETQLRFLLTNVKWGNQMRYQVWFANKFLCSPDRESIISDIIRFICCSHHPSNEIIQSNVISRWAVIGWLLKCCRKNHFAGNAKLALFYDWLFYDELFDNVMNIEPAILLMVNNIPKYVDMTQCLLEFLLLLVDNYDVHRKDLIMRGVSASFSILLMKGVVSSLETLTSCILLSPLLRERLVTTFPSLKPNVAKKVSPHFSNSVLPWSLPSSSTPFSRVITKNGPVLDKPIGIIEKLVDDLKSVVKNSKERGLQILEKILFSFVTLDCQTLDTKPEVLASQISKVFESSGYKMFVPLKCPPQEVYCGDEFESATALVIRTFIFSQHVRMHKMILFWFKNGYPVGPRLLSYVSTLSYEAYKMTGLRNSIGHHKHVDLSNGDTMEMDNEKTSVEKSYFEESLLKFHIDGHISFTSGGRKDPPNAFVSASTIDMKLVAQLVEGAFTAYRRFLKDSSNDISCKGMRETDKVLARSLLSDLTSCCGWKAKGTKLLFRSIFCHLSDLSTAREDFIQLLVNQLFDADFVSTQFELGLKRFSIFGDDMEIICLIVKRSFNWDLVEQQKFWSLLISELGVSEIQVDKMALECLAFIDPSIHFVAVGGLYTLFRCHAPSPELVGVILSLPITLGDFAAAVLASWVSSNGSMLLHSLAEWLQKFNRKNGASVSIKSISVRTNYSAITGLLQFLETQRTKKVDCLSSLVQEIKVKLADIMVLQDSK